MINHKVLLNIRSFCFPIHSSFCQLSYFLNFVIYLISTLDVTLTVCIVDEDDVFPKQSSQPPPSSQQNNKTHPRVVARVLSIAGYIALMHLYHLDVSILSELKRRHNIQEEEKERKGKKNGKTPGGSRRKSSARDSSIHKVV